MSAPPIQQLSSAHVGWLTDLDTALLRTAYGRYPAGVVAICADVDGTWEAMIASSFVAVSIEPPLVAFCPQNSSSTWPRLKRAKRLGVSILGEDHHEVARSMAARTGDRFKGVRVHRDDAGMLLVHGASAWLDTTVNGCVPAGDHQIVLLAVRGVMLHETPPTVFHRSRFVGLAEPG